MGLRSVDVGDEINMSKCGGVKRGVQKHTTKDKLAYQHAVVVG